MGGEVFHLLSRAGGLGGCSPQEAMGYLILSSTKIPYS